MAELVTDQQADEDAFAVRYEGEKVPATKNREAGILPRFGGWHHFRFVAKLYTNENVPLPVAEELRRLGHDVMTVQESGLGGQSFQTIRC